MQLTVWKRGIINTRLFVLLLLVNAHLSLFKPTHVLFNGALSLKAILIMPSLRDVYRVVIVHAAEQLSFGGRYIAGQWPTVSVQRATTPSAD